jgi:SLOG cluster2
MTGARLLPPCALTGVDVALSVSDSADLARLGLTAQHCELAVAEIAQAVFIAGGSVMYGGRLRPPGFSQVLLEEVQKYADNRRALTLVVAEPEHRDFSDEELDALDKGLGTTARIICLDVDGRRLPITDRGRRSPDSTDDAHAYTGLRQYVTTNTDARVLVGGKVTGYRGVMPGVLEEALLSLKQGQPVYVAGGFGGAAAALARTLGMDDQAWLPDSPVATSDKVQSALSLIADAWAAMPSGACNNGLDTRELAQLAATHRPGDIASLVVTGLEMWKQSWESRSTGV